MISIVNQINLNLVGVITSTVLAVTSPQAVPQDLALTDPVVGQVNLDSLDPQSGEISSSLVFKPAKPAQPARLVMAAKAAVKVEKPQKTLPESPYEALFTQFANQFGVEVQLLKRIAWCESHYHPDSYNRSGGYGGIFQFSSSTWQSTRRAMGLDPNPDLRFDAEQAIMTAAFKIAAGGVRAWPVCSR
ncbi:hypothetical protein A2W24_06140 [Microgenomates group bacterium RBG_16_45_19]|nr:MAG: hypothetical protein A2W24_06140 [Microgenomates group bacterium RBG_16_45_19]